MKESFRLVERKMVERVAIAIEKTAFAPHELPLDPELHGKYRMTARVAIAAMREPTEAMAIAGAETISPDAWCAAQCSGKEGATDIYQAMVDEAMKP